MKKIVIFMIKREIVLNVFSLFCCFSSFFFRCRRGVLALESFVQLLEKTPNDVSAKAAQRMVPELLGFVIKSHEAFCLAATAIHQISDRLDNNLQTIVVEEKRMNDSLNSTQQSLVKLED